MELDPAYVDVAVLRWQAFTGETATLADDGQTFGQVRDERAGAAGGAAAAPAAAT